MADETQGKDEETGGIGIEMARANLGDLVLRASYGNERIAITRKGRLAAYLIGAKDYERLAALDAPADGTADVAA